MQTVSLFEAKTHLSHLVDILVEGQEESVVISRQGKAVVRLTAVANVDASRRIGLARGRFTVPDDIDGTNDKIAALFPGAGRQSS